MKIRSIKKIETPDKFVYDLTVDKHHCYFANKILVHNCHRISDLVYTQKILPMFSGSAHPKIVKIGISAYRNNFYESCHSDAWTTLIYPWYKCPLLFRGGKITVDNIDYPKTIVDHMPLSYKLARFPNNPELHYESISKTSEEDFDSQYEMRWVESVNLFLNDTDLSLLFGDHCLSMEGQPGDTYYFGLDCAGGSEIAISNKRDKTSLTIIRKTKDNVKQLCYFHEWQGSIPEQIASIIEIVHPKRGKFKCVGGCGDYGNLGSAVADYLKKEIPLIGVKYAAKEAASGKNFKNAMFDQFLFELRQGRFKYPSKELFQQDDLLEEHYNQWRILEKRQSRRDANFIIKAPPGQHDDMVNSAILALWAADRADFSKTSSDAGGSVASYKFPQLVFGNSSGQNKAQGLIKSSNNFLNNFNKSKF